VLPRSPNLNESELKSTTDLCDFYVGKLEYFDALFCTVFVWILVNMINQIGLRRSALRFVFGVFPVRILAATQAFIAERFS